MTVRELKVNDTVFEPTIEKIIEHKVGQITACDDKDHSIIRMNEGDGVLSEGGIKNHLNSTKVELRLRFSNHATAYIDPKKAKAVQHKIRVENYLILKAVAAKAREKADEFFTNYLKE